MIEYNTTALMYGYVGQGMIDEAIAECDAANPENSCEAKLCKVEIGFSAKRASAVSSDGYETSKKHSKGFDARAEGNCEQLVHEEIENPVRQCCGHYPAR